MFEWWHIISTAIIFFGLGWAYAAYREPSIQQRLKHCEISLRIYDNQRCSEYWLRYPTDI